MSWWKNQCGQNKTEVSSLTKKGADEENSQRHIDDRRGDVDEPVRQKGGDPQEDDVVD